MARSIDDYQELIDSRLAAVRHDRRANRSTARAFAAAISAFAISALVITTSADALETGIVNENVLEAGTMRLTDDDGDRALFDLENMAPNRPSSECLRIAYEGSIVPVDLEMIATSAGTLAPYLDVTIEQGTGAGFRDCAGFEATEPVFEGTLAELVALGPRSVGHFYNQGDDTSFRFTFEMADRQAAVGQSSTLSFAWEVTQS